MPKTIAEAKVVGQRLLNSSTKLIDVYAPDIANQAVPGQFVNVQVCKNTAPLLRRPFGVAGVNKEQGTFTMIYRIIGEGTHILADVCAGDALSIATMVGGVDNHADATGLDVVQNIGMTLANLGSNVHVHALLLQILSSTTSCGYNVAQILKAPSDFHSLRLIHIGHSN